MRGQQTAASAEATEYREALTTFLDALRVQGRREWWPEQIVTNELGVGVGTATVIARAVPSLAAKHVGVAVSSPSGACGLCRMLGDPALRIPGPPGVGGIASIAAVANTVPFFDCQVVALTTRHADDFGFGEWCDLHAYYDGLGLAGMALQRADSGATVPGHAHVAMFDDVLPLSLWPVREVGASNRLSIGTVPDHPLASFVLAASEPAVLREAEYELMRMLRESGASYNVFWSRSGATIVVPRSVECDPLTGRRIGSPEVAGVLLSGVDGFDGSTIEELEAHMLEAARACVSDDWTGPVSRVGFAALDEDIYGALLAAFP